MRLGFFCQTPGIHLDMAKHLVASAKKAMPGVSVFHLTNGECPAQPDVDGVFRLGGSMPMAVRRMTLHSMLAGDWLFVDTDIVIRKDVRHVFDKPFDIAVTDRVGSAWEHSPDVKGMPYNMGVTFSRSPGFWRQALKGLLTLPPEFQEWEGDQRVVCALTTPQTLVLPGSIYNFTPYQRGDSVEDAAILHLKGPRKSWIGDYADGH